MFEGVDGTKCPHDADLVPQEGDDGLWCPLCGLKVMAKEKRPCFDCRHAAVKKEHKFICLKKSLHIDTNAKHYFVMYRMKDRTCWEENNQPIKKAMLKAGIAGMKKVGKMLDDKK